MYAVWMLGISIVSMIIAVGMLLGGLLMKAIAKQDREEIALQARRRKYFMNE